MSQFENDTWAFDYSDGLTPDNEKSIVAIFNGEYTSFPCNGVHSTHLAYLASGRTPADWVEPRTAQLIYDQDVLAPTDAAMLSPRLIEELYDWAANGIALPDASKAKFGPLVAARKTKRAARSA